LLLPVVALAPLLFFKSRATNHGSHQTTEGRPVDVLRSALYHILFVTLGYLLSMAPWFIRNLIAIGTPLSPGGTKTLWLTSYDDLYCYGCDLSLQSYLAWGWGNIWRSKLLALGVNFQRFLAENCQVFLLPLIPFGYYRLRRRVPFVLSLVYLFLAYAAHSLAFTYPGLQGGFFHASAPVLPFLYVAAAEGLDAVVSWVGRWRRWKVRQAQVVFCVAMVIAAAILSVSVGRGKVRSWRGVDRPYEEIGDWLDEHEREGVVMANNPPAFWYYTRRSAVVVPNAGVEMLLDAADRYGVDYVVLDKHLPVPLWDIYLGKVSHPRLQPAAEWGGKSSRIILYEVQR
jgi:hypothetical protein